MEKTDRESIVQEGLPGTVAPRSTSRSLPHYELCCQGCDLRFEDDRFALECPVQHEPALLSARYREKRFEPDTGAEGLFRYRKWLPGTRTLTGAGSSVTYKSDRLNRVLGLRNAWIVFSGYWPEKGATLGTPTFKDLEAWSVLSRIPEKHDGVLVIASAGSTAAAFATLLKAARYGGIEKDALLLLNITGGGRRRQQLDTKPILTRPTLELDEKEVLHDGTPTGSPPCFADAAFRTDVSARTKAPLSRVPSTESRPEGEHFAETDLAAVSRTHALDRSV